MGHDYVTYNVNERGDFRRVPAIRFPDFTVIVTGGWLKTASILNEPWIDVDAVIDPKHAIARLKEEKLGADIFKYTQRVPHMQPLFPYKAGWKSVAIIPITSYADWLARIQRGAKKNLKLSKQRGLTIKKVDFDDELIQGIVKINNESPTRQGRHFWHYGQNPEDVKKDYAVFPDRRDVFGAYYDNELVGFLMLINVGEIACIFQLLCMYKHHDKKTANSLIAAAVESCVNKGSEYLTYGRFVYNDNLDSPLTAFKRHNGFEERLVPSYSIPLTLKGRIAVRFNLHLGLRQIMPKQVKIMGRTFRAKILKKMSESPVDPDGQQ